VHNEIKKKKKKKKKKKRKKKKKKKKKKKNVVAVAQFLGFKTSRLAGRTTLYAGVGFGSVLTSVLAGRVQNRKMTVFLGLEAKK
jgi:hypothetical protein